MSHLLFLLAHCENNNLNIIKEFEVGWLLNIMYVVWLAGISANW